MFDTGTSALSAVTAALFAAGIVTVVYGANTGVKPAKPKVAHSAPTAAATRTAPAPSGVLDGSSGQVTVRSTEFKFSASEIDASAGKLKVTLDNTRATIAHEFVLLKTSADPASLKPGADGKISEAASVGEVSELKAGLASSTTFDLKAGRYLFVCNIPGHFLSGMHGVILVK